MELFLHRDLRDETCTLGTITNGTKTLQTMERPWVPSEATVAGRKGVSCVAPGRYRLERHSSDAHPNVWALVNPSLDVYHWESDVPRDRRGIARTVVLIHAANFAEELRGCIAPGTRRGKDGARRAVWQSRDAINQIRTWVGGSLDLWLTITEEKLTR